MNRGPRSRTFKPPLGRAAVFAALAIALSPSGAAAQDPAALVDAAIPHDSAISQQYREVQAMLDEAAAVVPDQPIAPPVADPEPVSAPAPTPPPPTPEPAPPAEQYHSETPTNVSVTQEQPSNINVSIRINSPGDDGSVVQMNNAGGSAVVEQVVERAAPQPEPAAPVAAELPATWEWVWTSACFAGGSPRAGAAAALPGWSWRWSCDEQAGDFAMPGPGGRVPDAEELLAAAAPTFAAPPPTAAAAPERPRARAGQHARPRASSGGAGAPGRQPQAGGDRVRAGPVLAGAPAHAPPAATARPRHAARAAARARPGDGSASTLPPGGEGPALGASTALGTVASLLLGIWIAVLVTACALVIPRIRRRRWSGHALRLTRLPSARLERPG